MFTFKNNSKFGLFNPKVSIIIPVYNGGNYLKEALESALSQEYSNIEIIVVDDGSVDLTSEIARSYGEKIRYFSKKNGGVASALNLGIQKAKGEYISWLSHDDSYFPDKIESQVKIIHSLEPKERNRTIIYSNYCLIDEKSRIFLTQQFHKIHSDTKLTHPYYPLLNGLIHGCSLLIPTQAFKEYGPFNIRLKATQDYDLWFKMFPHFKLIFSPLVLVKSRWHDQQGSKTIKNVKNESSNLWIRMMKSLSEKQILELEKDELTFLKKTLQIVKGADYVKAVEYCESKIKSLERKQYDFSCLQVGEFDLIGNKFNGHELHLYLRENKIKTNHLVWSKESNDENTFEIGLDKPNKYKHLSQIGEIQKMYCLNNTLGLSSFDVLYSKLFLESDITHFHLIQNMNFDLQLMPIMSKIRPIVWTLHDPWAVGGHCIHHFDCTKWKSHCFDCPYLNKPYEMDKDNSSLHFELKKQALQNSTFDIIVASKWMKNIIEKSPILKGKKVHLIPFGINQDIFKPLDKKNVKEKLGIPKNAIVITFRCEYTAFKGMNYIESTLDKIVSDKQIIIITLIGKIKNKNKRFVYKEYGWIKDDSLLANIYNASDLFLMPSLMDSFGLMAAEAMSCGVLPIVLEGTALPDTVNAPECGVSVKRDEQEFTKVVQYYVSHDKERVLKARKCLIFAKKQYKKEVYVKHIIAVYKEVMGKFRITPENKLLLNQLKKHMMIDNELEQSKTRRNNYIKKRYLLFVFLHHVKYKVKQLIKHALLLLKR